MKYGHILYDKENTNWIIKAGSDMQARNQEKQGLEEDENSYFFFFTYKKYYK